MTGVSRHNCAGARGHRSRHACRRGKTDRADLPPAMALLAATGRPAARLRDHRRPASPARRPRRLSQPYGRTGAAHTGGAGATRRHRGHVPGAAPRPSGHSRRAGKGRRENRSIRPGAAAKRAFCPSRHAAALLRLLRRLGLSWRYRAALFAPGARHRPLRRRTGCTRCAGFALADPFRCRFLADSALRQGHAGEGGRPRLLADRRRGLRNQLDFRRPFRHQSLAVHRPRMDREPARFLVPASCRGRHCRHRHPVNRRSRRRPPAPRQR